MAIARHIGLWVLCAQALIALSLTGYNRGSSLPPAARAIGSTTGALSLESERALPAHRAYQDLDVVAYLPAGVKRSPLARGPRAVPSPTRTSGTPVSTPGGRPSNTPTPTEDRRITHSTSPSHVLLQIGFTGSNEIDMLGEEINGTPWLTLFGDGRIVVGHRVLDNTKPLFEGHVDEERIQLWLDTLVRRVLIEHFEDEPYEHPNDPGQANVHVYLSTDDLTHGVHVADFLQWERNPPAGHPWNGAIQLLIGFVRSTETWATENVTEPFVAQEYTLLVREPEVPLLPGGHPAWGGLDVKPIADRAPPAGAANVGRLTGHHFTNREEGEALAALIEPEWQLTWAIYSRAAEFRHRNQIFWIGLRAEISAQSYFLPPDKRAIWYRRDAD